MPRNTINKKAPKAKFLTDELTDLMNGASFEHDEKTVIHTSQYKKEEIDNPSEEVDENNEPNKTLELASAGAGGRKRKLDITDDVLDLQKNILKTGEVVTDARRQESGRLLRSLAALGKMLEADGKALLEDQQTHQSFTNNLAKSYRNRLAAHGKCAQALTEIQKNYAKSCEERECQERESYNTMAQATEEKFKKMKEKLDKESRRSRIDALRKSMMYAMQYDM